jgi:ornithine cyclodeaminase
MSANPVFVDGETVHRVCDWLSLVDHLEAEHRAPPPLVDRLLMQQPADGGETDAFLIWPGWKRGEALGIKLVTSFPSNPSARGLPAIQAVYVLFDGTDGRPTHVIDATATTYWKTAADSALGARFLARENSRTLAVLGAGALAPWLVAAHRAVRPSLERVRIWNRTPSKAEALAERLRGEGLDAVAVADAGTAVREADIVTCATSARSPVLRGAWLQPGTHVDLVGGFTPEMRESDDETVRRATIFVDSRRFTVGVCGDLVQPMRDGVIAEDAVLGDLFDLCTRRVRGRRSPEEITLFKNGGGAHLDLMTAGYLAARLATRLPGGSGAS